MRGMLSTSINATANGTPSVSELAAMGLEQMAHSFQARETLIAKLTEQVAYLQHQIEWFKRQLFGRKSERFAPVPELQQMHLGELFEAPPLPLAQELEHIPAHQRRKHQTDFTEEGNSKLFFDETKVPVETIALPAIGVQGLSSDEFDVINTAVSWRLAQRPGSYVILKYTRPVIKRRDDQTIHSTPAPAGVIEGSRAEVSFIAGVLMDKFAWHLPLYRQHQRLLDMGINVSRAWLTQLVHSSAQLLEPIYEAQLESIRQSRVKAMDETPIKAGRMSGQMKQGYFWPIYGERDEVCFAYHESRRHEHVEQALGLRQVPGSVLLSDGYAAYSSYANKTGVRHAQCWAHSRRKFFEAQAVEPQAAAQALEQIGALYEIEERIRSNKLSGENKRVHRLTHSKPVVDKFFEWVDRQFERQGLLPSNPLTQALGYVRQRRAGLEVFLSDADVPVDTNHVERTLRAIALGRKNWIFCWTEVGAKYAGMVQSLIATCRLHGLDASTYLIDVLQRVAEHPAARVAELTPAQWKQHFANNPLRSDLYRTWVD